MNRAIILLPVTNRKISDPKRTKLKQIQSNDLWINGMFRTNGHHEYPNLGYSRLEYNLRTPVLEAVGRSSKTLHSQKYEDFRERLRTARADAGMTQIQAARKLGRPQSYVSKSEAGERRVDVIELAEFAHLYGRDVSYFLPAIRARRS